MKGRFVLLISFVTLILALFAGIFTGLVCRKKGKTKLTAALALVFGVLLGVALAWLFLWIMILLGIISNVNPAWFKTQCIWLTVMSIIGWLLGIRDFSSKKK